LLASGSSHSISRLVLVEFKIKISFTSSGLSTKVSFVVSLSVA